MDEHVVKLIPESPEHDCQKAVPIHGRANES